MAGCGPRRHGRQAREVLQVLGGRRETSEAGEHGGLYLRLLGLAEVLHAVQAQSQRVRELHPLLTLGAAAAWLCGAPSALSPPSAPGPGQAAASCCRNLAACRIRSAGRKKERARRLLSSISSCSRRAASSCGDRGSASGLWASDPPPLSPPPFVQIPEAGSSSAGGGSLKGAGPGVFKLSSCVSPRPHPRTPGSHLGPGLVLWRHDAWVVERVRRSRFLVKQYT